jgi:hypothetical protein
MRTLSHRRPSAHYFFGPPSPQVTIVNSAATLLPHDGFAPRFKAAMIDEVAAAGVKLLLNTRVVRYCCGCLFGRFVSVAL